MLNNMGKIDNLTVQKIKEAANIVDVVGDFLDLKRKGVNYQCLCPFHQDNHIGSFVVRPPSAAIGGNTYRCFSCDAKGGPIEFLMNYSETKLSYHEALLYLAQKYGIYVSEEQNVYKKVKPSKPKAMQEHSDNLPKRTWPAQWIGYYKNLSNDNFVQWLRSQRWDACQRARIDKVLNEYHVGHTAFDTEYYGETTHHEWTVWWMLDDQNVLHNGHLMKYKPDGHRDKESSYSQTWLHARMSAAIGPNHFDCKKELPSYCLFGLHLLNAYPGATVNIVESEKTAVIMAIAYGNNASEVWMACSGMQRLSREYLMPVINAGRKIQLFPDRDGIDRWIKKANELSYHSTLLNTKAVKEWWQPQDGEKADIADVVLRIINEINR